MSDLISEEMGYYFFGSHFDPKMVNDTNKINPLLRNIKPEIEEKLKANQAHCGLRVVTYLDFDTGKFFCGFVTTLNLHSTVSFYITSNHRVFSGTTLACVPLQFCLPSYEPEGEYLVYKHTYKKSLYTKA